MDVIEPVRASLVGLIEHVEGLRDADSGIVALGADALAQSDDELDASLDPTPRLPPARTARHYGGLQLHASGAHLLSMCRLLEMEATVVFSDKVLLRAGIEAAARAFWLLDPDIKSAKRAGRGLAEHLSSGREMLFAQNEDERADSEARRAEPLDQALKAGLLVAKRPSAADCMELLFADQADGTDLGSSSQRFLSLFVHSTPSGLLSVGDRNLVKRSGDGEASMPLASDARSVCTMTGLGTLAYVIAADAFPFVHGRRDEAWARQVHNAMRLLRPYLT